MEDEEENYVENLIEAVRSEKILYEKNHSGYLNKVERSKAWQRVGEKVGKEKAECEKRWRLLRERFTKKLKEADPSGSGANETITWPYFENMLFLKDYIKKRNTRDNANEIYLESGDNLGSPPPSPYPTSAENCAFTEEIPRKKTIENQFEKILNTFAVRMEKNQEDNEDKIFLQTICSLMDPLPIESKDSLKSKIFQLVMEERKILYENFH